MLRVCYFLLLVTLIFQHFTILCAISPAPSPKDAPPTTPTPTPTYIPTTPTPAPSWPSPAHNNNQGSPPSPSPRPAKSKGSKGMSGGQKAGLAFGVIAGAALLGFAGMVYAKRRKNIRRSRNIRSVELGAAFVRRPSP